MAEEQQERTENTREAAPRSGDDQRSGPSGPRPGGGRSGPRPGGDRGGDRGRRRRPYFRKKIDKIKAHNLTVSYRHPEVLRRFTTDSGKILPRRITGTSAKNQRKLVREIKRARYLGLLPMG